MLWKSQSRSAFRAPKKAPEVCVESKKTRKGRKPQGKQQAIPS
jgi:hypothetical protein